MNAIKKENGWTIEIETEYTPIFETKEQAEEWWHEAVRTTTAFLKNAGLAVSEEKIMHHITSNIRRQRGANLTAITCRHCGHTWTPVKKNPGRCLDCERNI